MFKNRILFFLFSTMLLFQSCLKDDLGFPEDEDPVEVTKSIAIVSLLNAIETGLLHPDDACFDFVYPIDLGFNNDITISIENKEGLLETAGSQSSGFHVNSISYPFLITSGGQLHSIENETAFREILYKCFISSFREFFDLRHKQCFGLAYPLTMLKSSGEEVTISSLDDFFTLYDSEGHDYQPQFVFPVSLKLFAKDEIVEMKSYYDLYQTANDCKGCPELSISYTVSDHIRYKLTANLSDDITSFDWYIDSEFVLTGTPANNIFEDSFPPGTYQICIKATTEDCVQGTEYCKTLVVEEVCPELHFEPIQWADNLNVYNFTAQLSGDNQNYKWYIDGVFFAEGSGTNGSQLREIFLETGIHEVCIETENDLCPTGVEYCKSIVAGCLPVSFTREEEGWGYLFEANFEGKELITYIWAVYDSLEVVKSEFREPGSSHDHLFEVAFEDLDPGVYDICIKQDGPCAEQKYCERLEIPQ